MTRHRIPAPLRLLLATLLMILSSGPFAPTALANDYFTPNPAMLSFGNQAVGTTSDRQTLIFTNQLSGNVTLGTPIIAGDFTMTGSTCIGQAIPGGDTCLVTVAFAPQSAGPHTGTVSLPNFYYPDVIFGSAPLTGTGIAAGVTADRMTLPFGSQLIGTQSGLQYITLTSNDSAAVEFGTITTASTDFVISGAESTCPAANNSLNAGQACTLAVAFAPQGSGSRTATLTISHPDAQAPPIATITLSGTGTLPTAITVD